MGYTHYAYINQTTIPQHEWDAFCSQIHALTVAENWAERDVNISDDIVQVKGNHEWFVIPRNLQPRRGERYFTFTKTARKPYDYIIVACYIALNQTVSGVELASDGDYIDLSEGRDHYMHTMTISEDDFHKMMLNTIHDARPEWYIGDPCYAIADHEYNGFIDNYVNKPSEEFEGTGVEFHHRGNLVRVYNSGLGGDGVVQVGGYSLPVDSGVLSVMPARAMSDEGNGGQVVRSRLMPVFDVDTDESISLTVDGYTSVWHFGKRECVTCDEYYNEIDMIGDNCFQCHDEEDEEEVYA